MFHNSVKVTFYQILFQLKNQSAHYQHVRLLLSFQYSYNISNQTISPNTISDFGETENGEFYVTSLNSGNVYRVQSNGPIQYTFTGNGNWTNPANWSNNTVPPSNSLTGSIIAIRPIVGGECVVNVPVTISVGTKILIENEKVLRMNSNLTIQ